METMTQAVVSTPKFRPRGRPPEIERTFPRRDACEVLVTYVDGRTRSVLRAKPFTLWLKRRMEVESPGIASASLIRDLTREQYLRIKSEARRTGGPSPPPAVDGPARDAPVARVADAPAPTSPGVHAWEVLIRQHGTTRMIRVVCPTEAGATGLVMGLDGVDAAVGIRPMTLEEYREAAGDPPPDDPQGEPPGGRR